MNRNSTGNWSTGDRSTGNWSTGDRSTGNCSTGNWSTGNWSTGDRSTGNWSTGNWSTGDRSTGNWSTGNWSTGNWSTGNWSTGYRSTGDWSISSYSTGNFSTVDYSGFGAFDKPCTPEEWDKTLKPDFLYKIKPTKWVEEKDMTDEEKRDNPTYKITWGYLKTIPMKEAWKKAWDEATEEDKKLLWRLPNFDPDVFQKISGIDVREEREKMVEIVVEGRKIKISRTSAKALGLLK